MQPSFKRDPAAAQATTAALMPSQRKALALLGIGCILPLFLAGFFGGDLLTVLVLAAFSLACSSGALYMLWRLPVSRVSFFTFLFVLVGCVVTLVTALALA